MDTTTKPTPDATRKCTGCGNTFHREQLTVKRAVFDTMGQKYKRLKSRTVGWLCAPCLEGDPDWTQERWSKSLPVLRQEETA